MRLVPLWKLRACSKIRHAHYILKTSINVNQDVPFRTDDFNIVMDISVDINICNMKLLLRNYRPLDLKSGTERVGTEAALEGVGDVHVK